MHMTQSLIDVSTSIEKRDKPLASKERTFVAALSLSKPKGGPSLWIPWMAFLLSYLGMWPSFVVAQEGPLASELSSIRVGAERLEAYLPLLEAQRIGLVVNASARVGQLHLVDTLLRLGQGIERIFTPEHGYSAETEAGAHVDDQPQARIPIRSLYGKYRKPPMEDLVNLDLLIFDLQDVGARFYTYASTLHYVMEAAAEAGILLLLLDRPNPNGDYVDGPVRVANQKSFVGMHPIPIVHGLSLGELARMINGEGWLAGNKKCRLKVVKVVGWTHQQTYHLPLSPSPNLPTQQAVRLYPSLCLFEGTKMSIGRGTQMPFEVIGYPDSTMGSFSFVPISVPAATRPKHMHLRCYGRSMRELMPPRQLLLEPILYFYARFKEKDSFFLPYFDRLAGTSELREQIQAGYSESEIRASWQTDLQTYRQMRKRYLLYPDKE